MEEGERAIGITQEEVVDPVDLRVRQQPPSNSKGTLDVDVHVQLPHRQNKSDG